MQRWRLVQKDQEKGSPAPAVNADGSRSVGPYLTISREAGAGGSRIARLVADAVGWEVLDRQLLDCLAERYHTSPAMLELVDETTTNWITEIFGNWLNSTSVSQMQYVVRLSRVILMAARTGEVIFVGRGAQYLLPHGCGLRVRLVAPTKYRVQQIMKSRDLAFEDACDYVVKTDNGRQEFARNYFHHDGTDPHNLDLVINVEEFEPEETTHLIVEALASRFDVQRSS
jgi:cytidylate kinase